MTMHELTIAHRAAQKEREDDFERVAWQTAHLMNASGNMKRAVTADDLMGRKRERADAGQFASAEAFKAYLKRRQAEFDEARIQREARERT